MSDRELLEASLDDAETFLSQWERTKDPELLALAVRALLAVLHALTGT